ncbi:MAG: hypothetical protein JO054_02805 [Actinobacteria bacterium]|nr:hypothetical protein [Actinomycetota bacterium]MBV9253138.1 hypothetical protein [Actinomycetota bacterium]
MCDQLGQVRQALEAVALSLDPAALSPSVAERALADVTAIEHMAHTAKARLAARVAEGASWKRSGARSPAEHIAKSTGTSVGAVLDDLKLVEKLSSLPAVDAAARSGELSRQQAAAVASAASVAPEHQERLLGEAKRLPLRELQAECGRTRAAHVDREAMRRKHHAERSFRTWTDAEGKGHLHAQGPAEDIAVMAANVQRRRDRLFREAKREHRDEPACAYGFDALKAMLCGDPSDGGGAVGAKVIVRVDLDSLLRGYPAEDETCEVAGVPVAVSAVEDICASGSVFLTGVITKAQRLVGVVHLRRRPTAAQQTGLEWLFPTCAAEGCGQSARLQRDHRIDWAKTKVTVFDLLDLLCPFHHHLKTAKNWALVEGRGKRAFVAPDDPSHPQHSRPLRT